MAEDKVKIIDDSSDHKYFTIIPNYVLNHSSVYDRCLYIAMKRIAGENGSCWMSTRELANNSQMSQAQVRKSIQYLLAKQWIVKVGEKKGYGGSSNEYKIIDLWQVNNEFYSQRKVSTLNSPAKGEHTVPTGEHRMLRGEHQVAPNKIHEEEPINKIAAAKPTADPVLEKKEKPNGNEPMDYKQFYAWCQKSPHKHVRIIGEWADTTKPDLKTRAQWEIFIRRHCRAAKQLEPFTDDQLSTAFTKIEESSGQSGWLKKYTLETLVKFIV